MRISSPSGLPRTQPPRSARAAAGGFSVGGEVPAARAGGVAGIAGLVLPPLPLDPDEGRRRALRHGRRILDVLDDVRVATLGGDDAGRLLAGLEAELRASAPPEDEHLAAILDDIRIRGEVEIAKAEVRRLSKSRSA